VLPPPRRRPPPLSADFDAFTRRRGSARSAYPSIVAGGRRALCLHYRSNNHLLRYARERALFRFCFLRTVLCFFVILYFFFEFLFCLLSCLLFFALP
jgi:hypothetical protein